MVHKRKANNETPWTHDNTVERVTSRKLRYRQQTGPDRSTRKVKGIAGNRVAKYAEKVHLNGKKSLITSKLASPSICNIPTRRSARIKANQQKS